LEDETIALSVHRGWGLDVLISRIGSLAAELCGTGTDLVITRLRHREALAACVAALERFAVLADAGERIELQAEELRLATRALGQVTGRTGVEQVLDVIFADFCIGK
jgi:tRNA modification GTPase